MKEPESGWYKQNMTGRVGEWNAELQTFRPAGTEYAQYVTRDVIKYSNEYTPYEPSLEDLVYDSPTEYQPGDYVMTVYLDRPVYGVVRRKHPTGRYYTITGFFFNEKTKQGFEKIITVTNRVAHLKAMESEEKAEFTRLLWLCDMNLSLDTG